MASMRFAAWLVLVGCNGGGIYLEAERWASADQLFHHDPHWLGGDTASSIDLGDERTLWLFGDSFIATSPARTRRESTIVHNSIAVMTGRDPTTATMEHAWQRDATPGPYFADIDGHRLAPLSGQRVASGPIVIFLGVVTGTQVVRIPDPSGSPTSWTVEPLDLPPPAFAPTAQIGACSVIDGDHLIAVSVDGYHRNGRLVRWPLAAIASGDLATREWWTGRDWIAEAALDAPPQVAIPNAAPQCSLFRDPVLGYGEDVWLYVASDDQSAIITRESSRLEGPYTPRKHGENIAYFDCERVAPQARVAGTRTFGAKAHTLVLEDGSLAATYVDTATDEERFDPVREYTLYWPHFARLLHIEAVE
jgi:hypothetical protein